MVERRDFRFETKQPVGLTILGKLSRDADIHVRAFVVNISGRGVSLTTESDVPVNSAVRVDLGNHILLGEVCHGRQTGPSEYVCGVRLEQALTATEDLAKLVAAVMGQPQRAMKPEIEAVGVQLKLLQAEAPKERRRLSALLSRF